MMTKKAERLNIGIDGGSDDDRPQVHSNMLTGKSGRDMSTQKINFVVSSNNSNNDTCVCLHLRLK